MRALPLCRVFSRLVPLLVVAGFTARPVRAEPPPEAAVLFLTADARGTLGGWIDVPGGAGHMDVVLPALDRLSAQPRRGRYRQEEGASGFESWYVYPAFAADGTSLAGRLDFAPLLAELRRLGIARLEVSARPTRGRVLAPVGPGGCALGRAHGGIVTFTLSTASAPPPWTLSFGYEARDLAVRLALLLPLPLAALALLLRVRRRALRADLTDPATVWFTYWRRSERISLGLALTWPLAAYLSRIADGFSLGRSPMVAMAIVVVIYGLPPILHGLVAAVLGHRVAVRTRDVEWTTAETLRQAALRLASMAVPLGLIALASPAISTGRLRLAAGLGAAAVASWIVFTLMLQRALDLTPHAVTTGELRDRLFGMASRAGVKLQQLYVIPMRKARMANAFAVRGGIVMLTDYLLQHLGRREVDAVMAHEIEHLRRHHHLWLALIPALAIWLVMFVTPWVAPMLLGPWAWAALFVLALPATLLLYRRFERQADAGAVTLTGDPESMIRALAALNRLNQLPLEWGAWEGRLLTHPSTRRRAQAIAARAGLAPERVDALLASPAAEAERYPVPVSLGPTGKVFSTRMKLAAISRMGWTTLAVSVLTPLAVVCAAPVGSWHPGVLLVSAIFTGGLIAILIDILPVRVYRKLRRELAQRLRAEGLDPERAGAAFVGFAPDPHPRVYEHFFDWDVGFLFVDRDRLRYVGEEIRFELRRDQVVEVAIGWVPPGWIAAPRVAVRWSDPALGSGTFQLRDAGVTSMRALRRASERLGARLADWRRGEHREVAAPAGAETKALGPPRLGEVTSISPRNLAAPGRLLAGLVLTAVAAFLACTLAGLDVLRGPGAPFHVLAVACLSQLALSLPYIGYREPGA